MSVSEVTQFVGDSQESCMTNADVVTEHSLHFKGKTAYPLLKAITCFHFITTNNLLALAGNSSD